MVLKQLEQKRIRSLTAMIASARPMASSLGVRNRKYASREADLGPMPGNLPNSSINRTTGSAVAELLRIDTARLPSCRCLRPTERASVPASSHHTIHHVSNYMDR